MMQKVYHHRRGVTFPPSRRDSISTWLNAPHLQIKWFYYAMFRSTTCFYWHFISFYNKWEFLLAVVTDLTVFLCHFRDSVTLRRHAATIKKACCFVQNGENTFYFSFFKDNLVFLVIWNSFWLVLICFSINNCRSYLIVAAWHLYRHAATSRRDRTLRCSIYANKWQNPISTKIFIKVDFSEIV